MAYASSNSGAIVGLETHLVSVEVSITRAVRPRMTIVGLAGKEVEESRDRVISAIKNTGFQFPVKNITVNLAPADLPKKGSYYDLPIAIAILKATKQIVRDFDDTFFIGELSLDGKVNFIKGVIPLAILANSRFKNICLPKENAPEASIMHDIDVKPVSSLKQLVDHLNGAKVINSQEQTNVSTIIDSANNYANVLDFKYIKGQETAKRALEIAAAGGHNISMLGPPGAGKTLLARSLQSILPKMTSEESIEATKIHSISGLLDSFNPFVTRRPFRSPHHSTSRSGLLGGGTPVTPGEISIAHNGVLFLDEFPEFPRGIIESLRQPLEDGVITISRARQSVKYPSDFMLVLASNPCPCGNHGSLNKECNCSRLQITRYKDKLSGPILDRVDLHVKFNPVDIDKLGVDENSLSSSEIRSKVERARIIQNKRYDLIENIFCNAQITTKHINDYCQFEDAIATAFLSRAAKSMMLSARAFHKIIKISRTIADLSGDELIKKSHIAEALQYRAD